MPTNDTKMQEKIEQDLAEHEARFEQAKLRDVTFWDPATYVVDTQQEPRLVSDLELKMEITIAINNRDLITDPSTAISNAVHRAARTGLTAAVIAKLKKEQAEVVKIARQYALLTAEFDALCLSGWGGVPSKDPARAEAILKELEAIATSYDLPSEEFKYLALRRQTLRDCIKAAEKDSEA